MNHITGLYWLIALEMLLILILVAIIANKSNCKSAEYSYYYKDAEGHDCLRTYKYNKNLDKCMPMDIYNKIGYVYLKNAYAANRQYFVLFESYRNFYQYSAFINDPNLYTGMVYLKQSDTEIKEGEVLQPQKVYENQKSYGNLRFTDNLVFIKKIPGEK
jgi:hypothetical protein